ncbi:MAG: hypothetical protein A3C50_01395 [Candidatus Staskawiczbacteria bacterium RIFCSPHIGHO2_02_FULL_43_16]|uniref:DDH domain-containing protein n=1 Tax=Candidatus Staskawiczbacteria bacterium RIFCSPHIGHO2_01_FULL_41_41 TaxID=1802203 RepID=A0A1G2HSC0_9BACT|nr:MAG: hypothetical protein A2822_02405 [Candidatus Staskawiczbacteria bacterium RIFCSPHIGHO2_01_FULL_41_41]OGZ69038.1 MAG: hypothetical protein A3C50_01395 [Candidatus Staskawiczbacteria bacterium RIFCSPHIGHO2_02_FULL_43_16]OGZ74533.1 MAG: hypothetical protein A3A12_02100 [Candidatus Staskawiczbacteria bacterium RIFCSPLOWO2_01_FULL_43_17b]
MSIVKNRIKNLTEAAQRIKKAALEKERIIIYGDSDADGVCSTVILQEAIKNLGGSVFSVMFPDRENDGYGVNKRALGLLKGKSPALFITLDLGIGNVAEVEELNAMGFEVIIIDHHEPLDKIPAASIVVDVKQPGDNAGFEYLCNAGLTFKLVEEMFHPAEALGEGGLGESLRNSLLELVALATISDMVPQIEDNKLFIERGLRSLQETYRPGLRAFFGMPDVGSVAAGGYMKIISYINTAESVDFMNDAFLLLTSHEVNRCRDLAEGLAGKSALKQQKIASISQEVERRIAKNPDDKIIFEGDPAWKLTLAGPVASIIAQKYQKPTFIYKKMDTESAGSVRSLREGENSVDAMALCKDLLITYGGHAKASGFRLKNEDLDQFKQRLGEYFIHLRK